MHSNRILSLYVHVHVAGHVCSHATHTMYLYMYTHTSIDIHVCAHAHSYTWCILFYSCTHSLDNGQTSFPTYMYPLLSFSNTHTHTPHRLSYSNGSMRQPLKHYRMPRMTDSGSKRTPRYVRANSTVSFFLPVFHSHKWVHVHCIYRIAGNFGEVFNLAIWRIRYRSPN